MEDLAALFYVQQRTWHGVRQDCNDHCPSRNDSFHNVVYPFSLQLPSPQPTLIAAERMEVDDLCFYPHS